MKIAPQEDSIPLSHAWAALLLRIVVGWVFLTEGIQKFLFPAALGVGRFAKIGIPWPNITAPFVGGVEIICGMLLIIGLLTRVAAIPLLIDIAVAIATTKIPMLLHQGFWPAMHEGRTDFCMLLGLIAILCIGGGYISCDAKRFFGGE
jgi:putative oxidoreductase